MFEGKLESIKRGELKVAVVGLGYVGLPLAHAFAEKNIKIIGFDINQRKIDAYKSGKDVTNEIGDEALRKSKIAFTSDPSALKEAAAIIIAVPTPVNEMNTPDLSPLISACQLVGKNLGKDTAIAFESTVYPGATEDDCVPVLEKYSGMKCGKDFKVGYSPERINPGDHAHRLESIVKVVSGQDAETLEFFAQLYGTVVAVGVHRAQSIKVAEASKVIENAQRDLNIAFTNELSMIFDRMHIDTEAVLQAAGTKWNFLKFSPGLVGGHCIGVDPYYLSYKAQQYGYHAEVILAGRRVNDGMGPYVGQKIVKLLSQHDKRIKGARVGLLGITFKENVADVRNSKVVDVYRELKEFGIDVRVADPVVDPREVHEEYGIELQPFDSLEGCDLICAAVPHDQFKNLALADLRKKMTKPEILVDLKRIWKRPEIESQGITYWGL